MSDVQRITLGVLPENSVPDPILFIFRDSEGDARDLSGADWSFTLVLKKGEAGTPIVRDEPSQIDTTDAATGQIRYQWAVDDLDTSDSVKVQMYAQRTVSGAVVRRHISDIAVITVATSPVSETIP